MKSVHTQYSSTQSMKFEGAIELRILLSGTETNGSLSVFEDIVQPGIGPGRHIHHGQDETFLFLEGEFVVEIDGKVHEMSRGDVAFVPRETVHAFKNVGNTVGRLRYIFSPALKMEAMFGAFFEADKTGELNEAEMKQIAALHGQTFVGPPL